MLILLVPQILTAQCKGNKNSTNSEKFIYDLWPSFFYLYNADEETLATLTILKRMPEREKYWSIRGITYNSKCKIPRSPVYIHFLSQTPHHLTRQTNFFMKKPANLPGITPKVNRIQPREPRRFPLYSLSKRPWAQK